MHGGDIYSYMNKKGKCPIDFSANINPLGLPGGVKKKLKESVDDFSLYPDVTCNKLKNALCAYENINKDYFIFGNGAADLIFRLVYAVKPKKALLLAPAFSEYEAALKNAGCSIAYYYLKPENSFKVQEDLLSQIDDVDMLFLCNPNNPTGMVVERELMLKIVQRSGKAGCCLVVDECFIDFLEKKDEYTCKALVYYNEHLIVLKAFTKIFAMAGLRLGYIISSSQKLLNRIEMARQPWSVSVPAQLAGIEAVNEIDYIEKTIRNTAIERQYLFRKLQSLGLNAYEGYANYILFQIKPPVDLYRELYKKGILIRKCEDYIGLDKSYFRIAVKNRDDNQKLITALEEILGGDKNG